MPRSAAHSTTSRLPFFSAIGRTVVATSSTSAATANDSRCSSILPASILERSRMSLMSASRWRAGAQDALERLDLVRRARGSRASSSSISLTPMMAFSGVRSSWLMLARNCDLCWLASSSSRLFSSISRNSRAFWIASADCARTSAAARPVRSENSPRRLPPHDERADDPLLAQQRHGEERTEPRLAPRTCSRRCRLPASGRRGSAPARAGGDALARPRFTEPERRVRAAGLDSSSVIP